MTGKRFFLIAIAFNLFFTVPGLRAQFGEFICGMNGGSPNSRIAFKGSGGSIKPTFVDPNPVGRNFKVAILYFKAADDNFTASDTCYTDYQRCLVAEWPADSAKPNWMGEMLIDHPFNAATVDADTARRDVALMQNHDRKNQHERHHDGADDLRHVSRWKS